MTNKQAKKNQRRRHIAAVNAVQNQWIREFGLPEAANRHERHRRFNAARALNAMLQGES
jgi:hypothetical protein